MILKKYSGLLLAFLMLPTQLLNTAPNEHSFKKGIAMVGGAGIVAAAGIYAYKKMTESNNNPKKKSFFKQASDKMHQAFIATKKICAAFFEELLKEPPIHCGICLEDSPDFTTLVCKHQYCRECLESMVDIAIKEKTTTQLKCPECNQAISPEDVKKITNNNQEKMDTFADITTRELLREQPNAKQCPTPDCPYIFLNDDNNKQLVKCPECKQEYCSQCLIKHPNMTCEQAQAMLPSDGQSAAWLRQNSKPCPRCNVHIAKPDEGCLWVTCRFCKNPRVSFCWNCLDRNHHVWQCNKPAKYTHDH